MEQKFFVKDLTSEDVAAYVSAAWAEVRNRAEQAAGIAPPLPENWREALEIKLEGEGLSPEMVLLLVIFKKSFAAAAGVKAAQMAYDVWHLAVDRIKKDRGIDAITPKKDESSEKDGQTAKEKGND
jgi:hypothetical protein